MPTTLGPTTVNLTTKGKFVVVVCLFDMFNVNNCLHVVCLTSLTSIIVCFSVSNNWPTSVDLVAENEFFHAFCLLDLFKINNVLFQCQQQLSQPLLILPLKVSLFLYFVWMTGLMSLTVYFSVINKWSDYR